MPKPNYEVVVGNIGTVYDGPSRDVAKAHYDDYVEQSKTGYGRAGGEPVFVMHKQEIIFDYDPTPEFGG